MGMFSKSIFFTVLSLLLVPASTHLRSTEQGYISVIVSQKGLDFAKDLVIQKALTSLVPIQLPEIVKSLKIPFVGEAQFVLSNITIYHVGVDSSHIATGDEGIVLVASGATANLSMNWEYSYRSWLFPFPVSDHGAAFVQVEGMQVGLTVAFKNQEGTLKLSLLESGCHVEDISIKLDGGASWLYQGLVDASEGQIDSAVEDAFSNKIGEGIARLDSLLLALPNEIPLDDKAALNVTFVNDPVMSNSTIEVEMKGLFTSENEVETSSFYRQTPPASDSCEGSSKMLAILLHENVVNSASLVHFKADDMHWIIDKIPEQSLLNTAGWKYIVPKLYKQYPNEDMDLNVSVSSPPMIKVADKGIDTTIYLDVTINVLDAGQVTPVACISLVISASCSAKISHNNLASSMKMKDFSMSLKWSTIGNLHLHLVQYAMSSVVKTVLLPYANLCLRRGIPLPILQGFTLRNTEILYGDSMITICSDVAFSEHYKLNQLPIYHH